ncbi:(deoxy)nucleoside triphosphate pyrophosphohydrolase [Brachybacterium saurashtrense]|uniref:8-oxo-dGTP diphosphatase n=1 Tax=Brachybacterium saurashtrense TaxID=556288 RepID=A0A345YS41_9MICO|nr:(deoxy)nucleoside triphosphate pyrophosphohydrolase [Brachybacterium saurashtrense]AXK46743.1 (deoxy)nucleoside triphosphate pyrophosphohydrolase [Brachybacterium saurashtrense]RRR22458.1 (deoxy)nucleoside triphosphate pyrophosphohydrolase [Brachybacterium saurashtrense]
MEKAVIRVVGAIVERGGAVFAARRNADRSAGGLWEFPGGKVEIGESPEAALRRELQEELSIDISVGPLVERSLTNIGTSRIELACYSAQFCGTDPVSSSDHDAMQWVPLDDLASLEWAPGDVPIISVLPERLHALRTQAEEA